ncbi:MAG: potassium/proton antiporter [Clostridium sp.]|uniref:potassium/proton antiporter n=1 Tax=Clostridium sp. TaxID=1506 RepID=UPI002672EC2D|nr:potassium/proton antiporter [Clostridium sp.]MDD7682656.1 potassium/proton antiporter [Clostridium sp.]MDY2578867.1 potassium/proton antiporter [Clostridium sp.]
MVQLMLCCGLILLICITSSKVLYRFGVPLLLIFIFLGMIFGVMVIDFSDFQLTGKIASIALVFIMFYGGFGTNWSMARPKAAPSILMSTLGTIITFFITGVFVYLIFKISFLESLLIGAVVSSTDAASVFAILRSQKLNLEGSLASLLEVESGSNDPVACMLTLIILTLMGGGTVMNLIPLVISQIVIGVMIGTLIAMASIYLIRHANFEIESFYVIFIIAIAIIAYSLSEWMGGNGYLSVYISGIIIGNSKIPHKKTLVHFLDGVSWIMQIILFFILGLLANPLELPKVIGKSVVISLGIIFIARPISVFLVLKKFDFNTKEKLFIAWVGLRGAASIVFAIFALNYGISINNDIYHIIFFIALISVGVQGTLIPIIAKRLELLDNNRPVLKTFNDYVEEKNTKVMEVKIEGSCRLINKSIMDANIPEEILIAMIKREGEIIIPKGASIIKEGDILVVVGNCLEDDFYKVIKK